MTPQNKNAIRKEMERGEKALKASQLLCENGFYEDEGLRSTIAYFREKVRKRES